jgi:hypothetical protein
MYIVTGSIKYILPVNFQVTLKGFYSEIIQKILQVLMYSRFVEHKVYVNWLLAGSDWNWFLFELRLEY